MLKGIYSILTTRKLRNRSLICERLEKSVSFLRRRNPFWLIDRTVYENKRFDASYIDRMIADAVDPYVKHLKPRGASVACSNRVAYLVTAMSDSSGGHNKLIVNGMKLLAEDYDCKLFLTHRDETEHLAQKILSDLGDYDGRNLKYKTSIRDAIRLAQAIMDYNPVFLFVYANPYDYWAIAIVALLKRTTNIKVLISQHTTHYPCIGVTFSDITIHAAQSFAYIDFVFRKNRKFTISKGALVCGRKEWYGNLSPTNKMEQRKQLGVPDGYLLTVSSGAGYKFFNADGTSSYFKMIRTMLLRNENVIHVIRTWGSVAQKKAIDEAVRESGVQDRLRVLPPTPDYAAFYNAADLYIDSIPVASALTMVELMRLRVPYVVFRNEENALWTFDEYQRDDYPFMYSSAEGMLKGVNALLMDEGLRKSEVQKNYDFYLDNFEGSASKAFLKKLIVNADHLQDLYMGLSGKAYNFVLDENGNPACDVLGGV